jgi:D-alanine-D-alanine ligase
MKKNIAVFFGGRSVEHDVSIITGLQIIDNADKEKYNTFPVYISRDGEWFCGEKLRDVQFYKNFNPNDKGVQRVFLSPVPGGREIQYFGKFGVKTYGVIDAAVLGMHGAHGEDGTLQGLFELADIPYSSPCVTGSAVGMDKIVMKCAFRGANLPVLDAVYFERHNFQQDSEGTLNKVEESFPYPVFVKPANLGSSIGISKAKDREGLNNALEVAFHYDRRVIVEKSVEDIMEINSAVMGYGDDVTVSLLEQPVTWKDFLTFDEKYLRSDGASKGMTSLSRKIPAPISGEMTQKIIEMSKTVFTTLDLKGVVRIDYIIDQAAGQVYVNEVNTIPGSLAFYLFEPAGVPFQTLIDKIIEFAERQMDDKKKNSFAYDSAILRKAGAGTKGAKIVKK